MRSLTYTCSAGWQSAALRTALWRWRCWPQVGSAPVAVLELQYETAATLLLRGHLTPDTNPRHRQIVDAALAAGELLLYKCTCARPLAACRSSARARRAAVL